MAQQIRAAQQKAALQGQAPPAWAIGAKCQALNPLEATWEEATVKGISATGNFVLTFTGREDELEEVTPRIHIACWSSQFWALPDLNWSPYLII